MYYKQYFEQLNKLGEIGNWREEDYITLKDNYIKEDQENSSIEYSKKHSTTKNVPIKYKEKNNINFNNIFFTILIILIIGVFASFQFKDLILTQYPDSLNYFSIIEEFGEYISKNITAFINMLIPKN